MGKRRLTVGHKTVRARALSLLQSPDFFGELRGALRMAGLVGEERNALTTYIAVSSRLLDEPMNLIIKGQSSAGKNFLARTVLDLLPKGEVKSLTSSSNRAWNYLGKKLKHKVVYVEERNKDMGPVHPARLLMSERKLIHRVTVRTGGALETKEMVTEGPISCISTTTKNRLEIDDETRNLSVWVDESEEQTKRIMRRNLVGNSRLSQNEKEVWQTVQVLLAKRASVTVKFPGWFDELVDYVGAGDVRVRRYFPAFLQACRTVCLLRSFSRSQGYSKAEAIGVCFSDFAIAATILNPVLSKSLNRGDTAEFETAKQVEILASRKKGKGVTAKGFSRHFGIPLHKAYASLHRAQAAGLLVRANRPERGNRKMYVPAREGDFLPEPEDFFMGSDSLPVRVKFVHPLTGEHVTYERRTWAQED